jgi:hypothetical protein
MLLAVAMSSRTEMDASSEWREKLLIFLTAVLQLTAPELHYLDCISGFFKVKCSQLRRAFFGAIIWPISL